MILAVTDLHPFIESDEWLEAMGRVLVVYRDPPRLEHGLEKIARITHTFTRTKCTGGW